MVSVREEKGKKNDPLPKKTGRPPRNKEMGGVENRKGHGKKKKRKRVGECGDVTVWGVGGGKERREVRGERK